MLVPDTSITRARTGLPLLVIAGVLWGTGGLIGTLLARESGLSALGVAAARLGLGGLLLVAFLLFTRQSWPRGRAAWTRIAVLGLLAAEFQACYFAAVAHTTVSLATLLTIGASPVLVLLFEAVTGRRRVGPRVAATAGLALLGLALLVGVPENGLDLDRVVPGGTFALLAAAGFATMTLVGARPVEGLDELASTGLGFTFGSLLLAPLALAGGLTFTATPAAFGLLLVLGAGPTAIAYAFYFRGLRTAAAGTAALMALLEPLVGTALAVVVLGERLGVVGWTGAGLLIVALVLASRPVSA
ncbi:DMT family transporter [Actinoplanes bogorensis]|uniref:DMT family transporter n=1 Tax=Paractinoplanes bogorensis TaxID=1610840 RepID=A0ABS5Z0J7_9ACTN|nr:DMT family transporter [Actinoplanes bogorensis]MBU2669173.1 DMT family transporter [Actinoplanes bogorensis]